MNLWIHSYTIWISWVDQSICRNSFVNETGGCHEENRTGRQHGAQGHQKDNILHPDGRWAHDLRAEPQTRIQKMPKGQPG